MLVALRGHSLNALIARHRDALRHLGLRHHLIAMPDGRIVCNLIQSGSNVWALMSIHSWAPQYSDRQLVVMCSDQWWAVSFDVQHCVVISLIVQWSEWVGLCRLNRIIQCNQQCNCRTRQDIHFEQSNILLFTIFIYWFRAQGDPVWKLWNVLFWLVRVAGWCKAGDWSHL